MDLFYTDCEKFEGSSLKEKQHNAGRYIVDYAAGNIYGIKNKEVKTVNNKPCFKYSDICFSISHCNKYAAAIFDDGPVGLDLEKIIPRNYKAISKRMNFKLKEDSLESFYESWTLYEAEYKLQAKVKGIKTIDFMSEYKLTAVSGKHREIDLKIYQL